MSGYRESVVANAATILNTATKSAEIDLGVGVPVSIDIPAAMTGTSVWFECGNVTGALSDPLDRASAQYGEAQVDSVSNDFTQPSTGGGAAGSYWIKLGQQILDGQGIPVAFIPCPLGGTLIAQWQPGSNHQDRATLYGSMVYRALQVGGVRAVLWHQGESEATIAAGLTSKAYYTGQLQALGDAVLADLGVPLVAAKIHLWSGAPSTDATHLAYVNDAVVDVAGTHNVLLGADMHLPTDIATDLHFASDAELLAAATRWYAALDAAGIY